MRLLMLSTLAALAAAIVVPAASAFRFTDEARNVPTGTVGNAYSHQLSIAGGCKLVTMRTEGSFPPGLRLVGSPSDQTQDSWRIEGTPTAPGAYRFWIIAGSEWPECKDDSTEEEWTIRIDPATAPPLTVTPAPLAPAVAGAAYSARLTATGGTSQRWSVAAGALPAGLALQPDGSLAGTPQAEGTFTFTARVSDGSQSASAQYSLVVRLPLQALMPTAPITEVGVATRIPMAAAGGVGPYRWELVGGSLPTGLVFDAATGALVGTPSVPGRYALALQVSGSGGQTARAEFLLRVNRRLEVVRWPLTTMRRGRFAVRRMFAVGGVGPRQWKVVQGRFPVGVRMNVRNGKLIGTPRQFGRFAFTVRVTDSNGVVALRTFALRVRR